MDENEEILRKNSFKITRNRTQIIKKLKEEARYYSPQELWEELHLRLPKLGLPTVYRILEELYQIGIASKLNTTSNQFYYYICGSNLEGNHHHFICRRCRRAFCLDFCVFDEIREIANKKLDAIAEKHFLQIEGICSECRKKEENK